MTNLDNKFFEEYIRVDNICKDMYGHEGMSAYISEMENCHLRERMFVPNWDDEFKTLKQLRWLRNQIAHHNDTYLVTDEDISKVKRFHNKLLECTDPLALLHQQAERSERIKNEKKVNEFKNKSAIKDEVLKQTHTDMKKRSKRETVKLIVISIIVVSFIVFMLLTFQKLGYISLT